jgi:hypothetical protein
MDINLKLENLRDENFKTKIKNEYEYLKGDNSVTIFSNYSTIDIPERITKLEKILNINQNKENSQPKNDSGKQKKDLLIAEIEKYVFRNQWNKLTSFHKNIKLKEYIFDTYGKGELQDTIIEELCKYSNEGRINTKKYVIYDPNAEKILSMPCLTVDFEKNKYRIKVV